VTAEALADSVAQQLSNRFLLTPGVPLRVSLSDVNCAFESGVVREDTINSTYVASQQQLTNPDYVRLQQELAAAQARLAQQRVQNANTGTGGSPWAAALLGAAEGLAASTVTKLQNQLAQTPPFIYQPVILSYSPVRSAHAKKAIATLTVTVEDASTGFANVETVSAEAVATSDGLRGVLPGDQQGLRNQEPTLTSDANLGGEALKAALDKVSAPISKFAASALLMRAERALKANSIAVALGDALLAKDLGATADDLGMFGDPLRELAITPLDRVNTIRFAGMPVTATPRPVRPPVAKALTKGASPRALSRPAVIEAAMGSVVTVKTGEATGSGFFVGSSGLMITNAHVVQGASKIIVRTRSQETFLASIVKLSAADDLALLRVQGLSVEGLPLGSLDAVEVGQDVIAIGSPLGLEGTVTRGIVSGLRSLGKIPLVQIDAAINPGNSGGPLLDASGQVIGVNTLKLRPSTAESLGFAIGVDHVKALFGSLLDR
jgi:S1-C subfamily serine protease